MLHALFVLFAKGANDRLPVPQIPVVPSVPATTIPGKTDCSSLGGWL